MSPATISMSVRELQVDESALTGESVPVQKAVAQLEEETLLADRTNMAYGSSMVTYGHGTGIVVATADHTEVGHISRLISSAQDMATPLTRKIARFSHILLYAILLLSDESIFVRRAAQSPGMSLNIQT